MTNIFREAGKYNLFVLNDITGTNGYVDGKLAIGNDAYLSNFNIGLEKLYTKKKKQENTLIVSGDVDIGNGINFTGNTLLSSIEKKISYKMINVNGSLKYGESVNFNKEKKYLTELSINLASRASNGKIEINDKEMNLIGDNNDLNIFSISGNNVLGKKINLKEIKKINLISPLRSIVIINILGSEILFDKYVFARNGKKPTNSNSKKIIWNFPDAKFWINVSSNFYGAVLACFATANTTSLSIHGTGIFNNFIGTANFIDIVFDSKYKPVFD